MRTIAWVGLGLAVLVIHGGRASAQSAANSPHPGQAAPPLMPRVRTTDGSIATIIRDATAMSATFRTLVNTIDRTDGIVYVDAGKCGHNTRACLAMSVTIAGPNRILRIRVDPRNPDWDVMGSIGHELRHAIELLADPSVTSGFAIYFFYQREASHRPSAEGTHQAGAFETNAAVDTGDAVRAEIRAARNPRRQ